MKRLSTDSLIIEPISDKAEVWGFCFSFYPMSMMSLTEFNLLTFEQKCNVVERKGIYLAGRNVDDLGYNLYAVYSFYVELCFNFSDDYLERIKAFKNALFLEPYIEEIALDLYF